MTKEELEKRLAIIESSIAKHQEVIQQSIANINLLQGSKNECLFWLDELAKPKSESEQPKDEVKLEEVKKEDQAA
jgi:hypothetical protein